MKMDRDQFESELVALAGQYSAATPAQRLRVLQVLVAELDEENRGVLAGMIVGWNPEFLALARAALASTQ